MRARACYVRVYVAVCMYSVYVIICSRRQELVNTNTDIERNITTRKMKIIVMIF